MTKKIRAGLYARVSTVRDQSTAVQEVELKEYADRRGWVVQELYVDRGQSGSKSKRPALDALMADCRRRKIDVVLVWKFDRFARSLRQLVTALEEFRQLGIDFVSCTEAIDTSIPTGELVFQIFGAIAQFERVLIGERVRAGLANARREGKRLGRPPVKQLSPDQEAQLKADRARGKASLRTLARKYGVSVWKAHMLCSDREVRV
jgi:DNA invertase Pin-like site-specific DNA recombinase